MKTRPSFAPKINSDDPSLCSKWNTSGSLGGFITLEEADKVIIKEISSSLCVLLTKTPKDPATLGCQRDGAGKLTQKGDYCSTTDSPGGCQDSFWLAATFAASAAKINDGAGNPNCLGIAPADAGTDASDSGSDASDAGTD